MNKIYIDQDDALFYQEMINNKQLFIICVTCSLYLTANWSNEREIRSTTPKLERIRTVQGILILSFYPCFYPIYIKCFFFSAWQTLEDCCWRHKSDTSSIWPSKGSAMLPSTAQKRVLFSNIHNLSARFVKSWENVTLPATGSSELTPKNLFRIGIKMSGNSSCKILLNFFTRII